MVPNPGLNICPLICVPACMYTYIHGSTITNPELAGYTQKQTSACVSSHNTSHPSAATTGSDMRNLTPGGRAPSLSPLARLLAPDPFHLPCPLSLRGQTNSGCLVATHSRTMSSRDTRSIASSCSTYANFHRSKRKTYSCI